MRGTRTWPSGDNPSHLPKAILSAATQWNSSEETQIKQFGFQMDFAPVDMEKIIVIVLFKGILSVPKGAKCCQNWIVMNRVLKLEVFLPSVSPIFLEVDESYSRRRFQILFMSIPPWNDRIWLIFLRWVGEKPPTSILWETLAFGWIIATAILNSFTINWPTSISQCFTVYLSVKWCFIILEYQRSTLLVAFHEADMTLIFKEAIRNFWRSFDSNLFGGTHPPNLWKKSVDSIPPKKIGWFMSGWNGSERWNVLVGDLGETGSWEGWRCLEKSCDSGGRKLDEIYIYTYICKRFGKKLINKVELRFCFQIFKFGNLAIAPTSRAMRSCLYDHGFTWICCQRFWPCKKNALMI